MRSRPSITWLRTSCTLLLGAALIVPAIWHTPTAADPPAAEIEAEDLGWVAAAKAKSVRVRHAFRDGVHERCWLSPADARAAAEQALFRRNVRPVGDDEGTDPDLLVALELSGHEISETYCVVVVRADVLLHDAFERTDGAFPVVSTSWRVLWSDTALLSGPRNGMSERVRGEVIDLLDAFATARIQRIERIAAKLTERKGREAAESWRGSLGE